MYTVVIHNGRVVCGSDVLGPDTYIGIADGKIAAISATPLEGHTVIDANGAYVTPGGIDAHVHIEEPGMPYCDTYEVATAAAVAGGTTTVVAFALQRDESEDDEDDEENGENEEGGVVRDVVSAKEAAAGRCYCDYGFHLIVRRADASVLALLPEVLAHGVSSIKVFTTYARLRLSDAQLLAVMLATRRLGITQMVHAENHDVIELYNAKLAQLGLLAPQYHAVSRPQVAEDEAVYRAIALAQVASCPLMIVHMLAPAALAHVRRAQTRLVPVMAETCPQYLLLKSERLCGCGGDAFAGARYVCSPPLRATDADLAAAWQAVQNGTVTIVLSDHAPSDYHAADGKQRGNVGGVPDYKQIPNGLPGVEARLALMWSYGVEAGRILPQRFVEVTAGNAARVYGLEGKGSLQVGRDADIVVWHAPGELDFALTKDMLHEQRDYTPYEGMRLTNWPKYTLLRGKVVYSRQDGVVGGAGGEFVARGHNTLVRAPPLDPHLA